MKDIFYKWQKLPLYVHIATLILSLCMMISFGIALFGHLDVLWSKRHYHGEQMIKFNLTPSSLLVKEDVKTVEVDENGNPVMRHRADMESFARQIRKFDSHDISHYAWYIDQNATKYLYFKDKPYNGWHSDGISSWKYYLKGRPQEFEVNLLQIKEWERFVGMYSILSGGQTMPFNTVYLDNGTNSRQLEASNYREEHYNVILDDSDQKIYSDIPSNNGVVFATFHDYANYAVDVIESTTVMNQKYLHIYTGYNEIGWIKEDPNMTHYTFTNYSERELADRINQVMLNHLPAMGEYVGSSFIAQGTMNQVNYRNEPYVPASTLKIFVLATLYHKYGTGELNPDDAYLLTSDLAVGGAGVIGAQVGSYFTLSELVDYVMTLSDNSAANMLIAAVGGSSEIAKFINSKGIYNTFVEGQYYGHENGRFYTTPGDAARLFALMGRGELNGPELDSYLINQYRKNTAHYARGLLPGVDSYDKSGTAYPERNDVVNFNTDLGSYTLTIYTASDYVASQTELMETDNPISRYALDIYNAYMEVRTKLYAPYDPALGFYQGIQE